MCVYKCENREFEKVLERKNREGGEKKKGKERKKESFWNSIQPYRRVVYFLPLYGATWQISFSALIIGCSLWLRSPPRMRMQCRRGRGEDLYLEFCHFRG